MSTDLTVIDSHQQYELSVDVVLGRLDKIQELMRRAMVVNVDYGQIPGTQSKPTLLKPGAEKLCVMFRLAARYKTAKTYHPDGHLTVESTCQILDCNEHFLGEASAMCSTKESKYAWRIGERTCPQCGLANIRKSKNEGGWYCWKKKGGCGATFPDGAKEIESQSTGRVQNPDLADSYNTVLRIAEKRSYLAAVRLATGSSSLFDEEIPGVNEHEDHEHSAPPARQQPVQQQKPPGEPSIDQVQGNDIKSLLKTYGIPWDDFAGHYKIVKLSDIPARRFAEIRAKIVEVGEAQKKSAPGANGAKQSAGAA